MGLARAIPAQRNTRGHWIIHPATSGGDASIPSSPGGARRREDAALGDPHQAPAHLSCFGWAEDFRNRVCQYCYGLFDQLRDGAIGHGPQCGSQRCSAGCRHRAVHHSRVRLAIRPLRPQANVPCGLPLFDCICLSDVLALSNPQSCCDRNHDRRSGQFRTGHHVRTGSGLGRGTLPRSLAVQRRLTRLPTWRSPERRVDTHVGVGPPPVDRRDVVYLALPDRCCRCDHRCNCAYRKYRTE